MRDGVASETQRRRERTREGARKGRNRDTEAQRGAGERLGWVVPGRKQRLPGTPLLDIKPYVPAFDSRETDRIGWFARNVGRVGEIRADGRFA